MHNRKPTVFRNVSMAFVFHVMCNKAVAASQFSYLYYALKVCTVFVKKSTYF